MSHVLPIVLAFLLCKLATISCVTIHKHDFPFWNHSLPWDQRIDDLMNRLKVDEMTFQLARGGAGSNGPAPGISRLKIRPYQWDTECLHGDASAGNATAFPQSIGLAAAFW